MGNFILMIFAVLRLTEIINYEKITIPIREFFGIAHSRNGSPAYMGTDSNIKNFIGQAISCFSCLSVWISGGMGLLSIFFNNTSKVVNLIFGLSYLTMLVRRLQLKFDL